METTKLSNQSRLLKKGEYHSWAQVNGRNAISWEQKFEFDVWYVDHVSLSLDLKILLMTIAKVLKSEGISQEGTATMERFTGNLKSQIG